ncbi:galactokinase [Ornithinimicrobium humiphilum]|uniref:Galactokinase n=1 Tax=Ornithinimicrobium humiphilum TaxID=125288 RepID=A0A543KLA0_9MICO|nr:galactokinase [Ornithinimicrobium humiphilum]TQM95862.1 galactokinase [Ornithinimicrobium humiphilum]
MAPVEPSSTFRSLFGHDPQGRWQAPGRVNLIGEHTDYNDGLCLPVALDRRTVVAAAARDDGRLRVASLEVPGEVVEVDLAEVRPGHPQGWAAYVAGVLWALREAGMPVGGLDLVLTSDVPLGAGLSSSAALEASVAAAADGVFGLGLLADDAGRAVLADACRRAENEIADAPTGGMDQAISLRAREGHALLLDCRDGSVEHVPLELEQHGLDLLVIDTRAPHALVDGQYGARRRDCEEAARLLGVASLREVDPTGLDEALGRLEEERVRRRVRHVVTEIERVRRCADALRAGDLEEVGRLFCASHDSLRDDYEVSCPELDTAVTAALRAGALGARMTGGGFGGSAIALVRREALDVTVRTVRDDFAAAGMGEPAFLVLERAGGPAGPVHG